MRLGLAHLEGIAMGLTIATAWSFRYPLIDRIEAVVDGVRGLLGRVLIRSPRTETPQTRAQVLSHPAFFDREGGAS